MEGDTIKNQGKANDVPPLGQDSNTDNPPIAQDKMPDNPPIAQGKDIAFRSSDIGRTTIAHKNHDYFTNIKKSRKSLKQLFTKKNTIIISIIVLSILVISLILAFFLTHSNSNNDEQAVENTQYYTEEQYEQKRAEIANAAEAAFAQAGTMEAIDVYDDALNSPDYNDAQKAQIHLDRAEKLYHIYLLYDENLQDIILADAYDAEKLNPTFETAMAIHNYESSFGNIEKSEHYLQMMKARNPDFNLEPIQEEYDLQ